MTRRSVAVVSGGLRVPSSTRLLADRIAEATGAELARRGFEVDLRVVEVRDHAHDVVNHLSTGYSSEPLKAALDAVAGADGLIAVTPIFNASYSGLFKSFFDALPEDALAGRPVLIAATGGTARHSLALDHTLRPMFSYLRAVVVPTAVFAAPEDWAGGTADGTLRGRIQRAGRELAEEVARHEPTAPADPFALTASFEQMFNGE
ncbi:FMN reductase [Micromonospora sp. HM5-17]|uniref:FMN reductase n=1 Tax=Micromonospora sp. HM5-17 TaxID=2487710 RepID=UPI000F48AFE1|nr:FMN reductase [Micromonospora sp. HM5-17]ROT27259.1 NADPH-dependent FMN reductase [Micromonospora sp. HM5-17]